MNPYEINELWETILSQCFQNLLTDEDKLYPACRNLSCSDLKSRNMILNLLLSHSHVINYGSRNIRLRRALCNIYGNLKPYDGSPKQIKLIGYDASTAKLYFRVSPRSFGYRLVLLVHGTMDKPTVLWTTCEYVSLEKEYWSFLCKTGGSCWRTIMNFKVYPTMIHSGIKIIQHDRFHYLDHYDNLDYNQPKVSLPFPMLKKSFTKRGMISTLNLR